jgi:hypothetical protein
MCLFIEGKLLHTHTLYADNTPCGAVVAPAFRPSDHPFLQTELSKESCPEGCNFVGLWQRYKVNKNQRALCFSLNFKSME